jgi:hypothetical protein
MSSHREAPASSKDPTADNTDVYAFVSPDDETKVTLVANFIPFQNPDGGPNFYAFGTDVLYEIKIHNTLINTPGQAPDIIYQFRFTETYKSPNSYMYNTAPIVVNRSGAADSKYTNLNRTQTYSVTRVDKAGTHELAAALPVPPCNIGVHSTPNYTQYVHPAINSLPNDGKVFAGQRADPFFVDLGAVFDLADLRPLQFLHQGPLFPAPGVDSFQGVNVFTIALQVPKNQLTSNASTPGPGDVMKQESVIGVYASASRQMSRAYEADGTRLDTGLFQQVSRLANPLFNELLIGIKQKDFWNSQSPTNDSQFLPRVMNPELANALPVEYPLAFRNLAFYNAQTGANAPNRQDLVAILLTGLPAGVIPGFQNNTGPIQADLLRLNMAIPVTKNPNGLGVIGGDLQGFPNGRRPVDDVATIELRAVAGATLPLTDMSKPKFVTDVAVNLVSDYSPISNGAFLPNFPYIATPSSGFATMPRPYAPN